MTKKGVSLLLILALLSFTFGCESMKEHKGAAVGAGAGAATGVAAGAIIGRTAGAAVVGGMLGALAGGVIGHYAYDQKRTREETAQAYDYQPSKGAVVRIEDVNVSPRRVSPGEEVQLGMTYAILTPSGQGGTKVTEIREITHQGQVVGKPEARVSRADGTYTSTIPLRLPAGAAAGEYKVRSIIQSASASDVRETSFMVR